MDVLHRHDSSPGYATNGPFMTKHQKICLVIGASLVGCALLNFCTDSRTREQAEQIVKERKVVTCEQLAKSRPGELKYVTLTDFEFCKPFYYWDTEAREHKPFSHGNYWDADDPCYSYYHFVPIYATTQHDQQPSNAHVRVILWMYVHKPVNSEILQQLKNRQIDGEISSLDESDSQDLQRYYPGIRPSQCQLVMVGGWIPTHRMADEQWWIAFGMCVIGIPLMAFGVYGKFGRWMQGHAPSDETARVW